MRRAGLDYWPLVDLVVHPNWASAAGSLATGSRHELGSRLRLFTARGGTSLFDVRFEADDLLVFGCETRGLPTELLTAWAERRVYVPIRSGVRSLNLANSVCLGVYTAMRSAGVPLPENDGRHVPHGRAGADLRPAEVARRGESRCSRGV